MASTEDTERMITRTCDECGEVYQTRETAPIMACPTCMRVLREAFWATIV